MSSRATAGSTCSSRRSNSVSSTRSNDSGPSTGAELADDLGVSAPHLTTLLEGVVATHLLDQRFGRFELNDTARRYLTTDGAASMSALVPVSPGPLSNWQQLTETVRTGRPAAPVDDDPVAFYVPLVEGTFTTISRMAGRADRFIRYSALDAPRVLELGAGGAPWATAILTANPEATAVVNDLPGVIDVAAAQADRARAVRPGRAPPGRLPRDRARGRPLRPGGARPHLSSRGRRTSGGSDRPCVPGARAGRARRAVGLLRRPSALARRTRPDDGRDDDGEHGARRSAQLRRRGRPSPNGRLRSRPPHRTDRLPGSLRRLETTHPSGPHESVDS